MPTVRLSENVVFRSFGSETVLLNLSTGQYHGVKGSGGRMLEVLAEQGDLQAAAQQIAEEYGHPLDEIARDMTELCRALAERSLIELAGELTPAGSDRELHAVTLIEPPEHAPNAAPALWVRSPSDLVNGGERPESASEVVEIVIASSDVFGSGAHPTTRACLELLLELAGGGDARGPLVDAGCGSGVLAIAAARLGFAPVLGIDREPKSLQAARANARTNGVEIEFRQADLPGDPLPPADTVIANLNRRLLLELADSWAAPPAHLIIGGITSEMTDELKTVFAARGMEERSRRIEGEWAALLLTGPEASEQRR